jgi:S-adenosylmethionine-diacylgycerolhomoserine-N-methlytransferase
MNAMSDMRVLYQLLRGQPGGQSHAERLEQFYRNQATHYDRFREGMLHGRDLLMRRLCVQEGHHVVELGCGTGRNLEFLEPNQRASLGRVELVDLCPSLLAEAHKRTSDWGNVRITQADAATFDPGVPVDRVYLSYALSMMPNWRDVLRNASRMLRPGGFIGVVDFGIFRPAALTGRERVAMAIWQSWFAHDGVRLEPARGAFLDGLFQCVDRVQLRGGLPYIPLARVPYYVYVGRK